MNWKIWLLGVAVLFSIILLPNLPIFSQAMIFLIGIVLLFILATVKSKVGRVFIVIILLISAGYLISTSFEKGLEIISIEENSTAYEQGLRQGQIIIQIDEQEITSFEDYKQVITSKFPSEERQKLKQDITKLESQFRI